MTVSVALRPTPTRSTFVGFAMGLTVNELEMVEPTSQNRDVGHPHPHPHPAPGTRHPAPGTRHPAPGARHPGYSMSLGRASVALLRMISSKASVLRGSS